MIEFQEFTFYLVFVRCFEHVHLNTIVVKRLHLDFYAARSAPFGKHFSNSFTTLDNRYRKVSEFLGVRSSNLSNKIIYLTYKIRKENLKILEI